jgi:hypothetical protein
MNKLIQCGDHKDAAWGLICVHLANQTSTDWVRVPQEPGEDFQNDFLCPACIKAFPNLSPKDLQAVCIHCIRRLRQEAV